MGQSVSFKRSRKSPTLGDDLEESAQELKGLPALDVPALRQRWAALFDADPSPNLGHALLLRAIAIRDLRERLGRPQTINPADPRSDIDKRSKDARNLFRTDKPVPGPC